MASVSAIPRHVPAVNGQLDTGQLDTGQLDSRQLDTRTVRHPDN